MTFCVEPDPISFQPHLNLLLLPSLCEPSRQLSIFMCFLTAGRNRGRTSNDANTRAHDFPSMHRDSSSLFFFFINSQLSSYLYVSSLTEGLHTITTRRCVGRQRERKKERKIIINSSLTLRLASGHTLHILTYKPVLPPSPTHTCLH